VRKPEALNVLPAFLFLEVIKHGAPSSYLLLFPDDCRFGLCMVAVQANQT
jgi:hypothetical protein